MTSDSPAPAHAAAAGSRPRAIVVAGALLIATGVSGVLGSLWLLWFGAVFAVLGVCLAVAGGVVVFAGVQCLRLRERGRILGLGVAVAGVVVQLLSLPYQTATSIVAVAMGTFLIWALHRGRGAFRPG